MSDPKQHDDDVPQKPLTGRQAYNLMTDTVAGPNLRLKDNLLQAVVIVVCLALGALVGYLAITDQPMGALIGGAVGLLAGLLGSGIYLMIYRAVKHSRGQHD